MADKKPAKKKAKRVARKKPPAQRKAEPKRDPVDLEVLAYTLGGRREGDNMVFRDGTVAHQYSVLSGLPRRNNAVHKPAS